MRKLTKMCLISLMALNLNAGEGNATNESQEDKVENSPVGILKVGTNASYRPFSYINMNFEVVGFEMDLMNALSKKANFEYEIVEMNFDKIIPSIENGDIDMAVSAIDMTKDRKEKYDFSNPYYKANIIYIKRSNDNSIKTKENLAGKKVGVKKGTELEELANGIDGAIVTPFTAIHTGVVNLKNKSLDAVIIDSIASREFLQKNSLLSEFLDEPAPGDGFGLMFAKGKHTDLIKKINAALDEIKADGTYEELLKKYDLGK